MWLHSELSKITYRFSQDVSSVAVLSMEETCWQLQGEEILLLRSVYCDAGEFLAYCVPIDSASSHSTDCAASGCPYSRNTEKCSTLLEWSAEDIVCLPRALLEKETLLSVYIKLQVPTQTPSDQTKVDATIIYDATVQFSLPKLYPKLEPPEITITSRNVNKECLMNLNARISSHCKALLPEPCLFEALEEIKAELMKLELSDTPGVSQEPEKGQFALSAGKKLNSAPCKCMSLWLIC